MAKAVDKTKFFKENLLYEIMAGRYAPLEKLPSERLFCKRYNISRTTARRALNDLAEEGIIDRRPPVGAFLSEDALEIIRKRKVTEHDLSVVFFMPPSELPNMVVQDIFATSRRYLNPQIKLSVVFNDLSGPLPMPESEVDIAVLHGIADDERLYWLSKKVDTMVILNTKHPEFNYITPDNYQGGRLMAEEVINAGHRHLAGIGPSGPNDDSDFAQRYLGIKSVCEEAGVSLEGIALKEEDRFNFDLACHKLLGPLLKKAPETSAILAFYDMIAIYVCESLRLRGVKIPDDMSVMGFDNHLYSQYCIPPLRSVKYPSEAVGMRLAEFILNFVEGKTREVQEMIQPVIAKHDNDSVKEYSREKVLL